MGGPARAVVAAVVMVVVAPGYAAPAAVATEPATLQTAATAGPVTSGTAATLTTAALRAGAAARPAWKVRLDELTADVNVSVSVRVPGRALYATDPYQRRVPASGEKLLLTMALYDHLDPASRFTTSAAATHRDGATIDGNLWIVGRGDPTVTGPGRFGKKLPFRPAHLALLARRIADTGVRRVTGRVKGAVSYFAHDWWTTGWKSSFPSQYVPLASGLSFQGNVDDGRHISDPEVRAARYLTRRLRALGVTVAGEGGAGSPPGGLRRLATISSAPLSDIVTYTNRRSSNYFAETLGKRLAVAHTGRTGTIAKGADAIQDWAAGNGVTVTAHDSSGLSYANRISVAGMTALLEQTRADGTFTDVRLSLPRGGQGTLEDRFGDVLVRAKTGTLTNRSTLSGWVWLQQVRQWASFSIMSSGTSKPYAVKMENRIVRVLAERAR